MAEHDGILTNNGTINGKIGTSTKTKFYNRVEVEGEVKTAVNGIEFGDVGGLGFGGDSLFKVNKVTGEIGAVLTHRYDDARAYDRMIDDEDPVIDLPIFTVNTDTLSNPSFEFATTINSRLFDVQLQSPSVQSDIHVHVVDEGTGILVWHGIIRNIIAGQFRYTLPNPAFNEFPIDVLNVETYVFNFSSENGDALLLGNSVTDQPWMTASFYRYTDETIAYLSDLQGAVGSYYVDGSTTIPALDRDGSFFKPFIDMTEYNSVIGDATPTTQNTVIISRGDYGAVSVPAYTTLTTQSEDPQAVGFSSTTFTKEGLSIVKNISCGDLVVDSSGLAPSANFEVKLININALASINMSGRGAGSCKVTIDGLGNLDGITSCNDVNLIMTNIDPALNSGGMNFAGTVAGVNKLDTYSCVVDINQSDLSLGPGLFFSLAGVDNPVLFRAKNSQIPDTATNGSGVKIERDANTEFEIIQISGAPVVENLDKSLQMYYDPTGGPLIHTDVQNAITEVANLIDQPIVTGTWTTPGNANISSTTITEVQNISGGVRFLFAVPPLAPVRFQTVTIVGFTTNTQYNGEFVVSNAGSGFMDVDGISFGSDELGGSFSSISTTVIEIDTVLSNGDTISIKTNGSTEYDGVYTVYRVAQDSFEFNKQFGTLKQGTWSSTPISSNPQAIVKNGSFDDNPSQISVNTATTFDVTGGRFGYIADPIAPDKQVKTLEPQTGLDITNFDGQDLTGVQRNVFVYVDVAASVPEIKLSFDTAAGQPGEYVYIGNFDLVQSVTPFDTLGSANQIVYTSYNSPVTGGLLDSTKGEYRLNGCRFNGGPANNNDLGITAGKAIRIGANTVSNYRDPDIPPANVENFINALNRQYIDTVGDTITIAATGQTLVTTQYAPGGVLTAVNPVGRFQIMYLYIFPGSWSARAALGNELFSTIADAEARVVKDPINQSPQTQEAILTTALIVAGSCTDLNDPLQAKFINL